MSRNTYYHGVVRNSTYAIDTNLGPRAIVANVDMTARALLTLAEIHNLNMVWIAPGCPLSHVDPAMFANADEAEWDIRYYHTEASSSRLARMKRVVAWRRHGSYDDKRSIEMIWIEQTSWGWDCSDPLVLLQVILRLRTDLAVPIDGHPGSVGRELMKWWVSKEHQAVPRVDVSQLPFKCGRNFAWKRPLEASAEGLFLHAYDKNSMYLSAATGAALGIGDFTYYLGADCDHRFILNKAGIWRIEASPPLMPNPRIPLGSYADRLPWPLGDGQEWVTTPIIKCLLEMGCQIHFEEGYQWDNSKRALGKWAEALWGQRVTYKGLEDEAGHMCYDSMKRIATASVGLLAHESPVLKDIVWKRPDWWSIIIETAKARMLYNMHAFASDYQMFPCMVFVDCLYYVSESSAPSLRLLSRPQELGGYKHKGTWPITRQILDWFGSEMSAGELVMAMGGLEVAHAR